MSLRYACSDPAVSRLGQESSFDEVVSDIVSRLIVYMFISIFFLFLFSLFCLPILFLRGVVLVLQATTTAAQDESPSRHQHL